MTDDDSLLTRGDWLSFAVVALACSTLLGGVLAFEFRELRRHAAASATVPPRQSAAPAPVGLTQTAFEADPVSRFATPALHRVADRDFHAPDAKLASEGASEDADAWRTRWHTTVHRFHAPDAPWASGASRE